jgi:hypothetical protein
LGADPEYTENLAKSILGSLFFCVFDEKFVAKTRRPLLFAAAASAAYAWQRRNIRLLLAFMRAFPSLDLTHPAISFTTP